MPPHPAGFGDRPFLFACFGAVLPDKAAEWPRAAFSAGLLAYKEAPCSSQVFPTSLSADDALC